eukprot:scaffold26454_cov78-Skeletonema_dohrnii-CCMP3373.AAC.3
MSSRDDIRTRPGTRAVGVWTLAAVGLNRYPIRLGLLLLYFNGSSETHLKTSSVWACGGGGCVMEVLGDGDCLGVIVGDKLRGIA